MLYFFLFVALDFFFKSKLKLFVVCMGQCVCGRTKEEGNKGCQFGSLLLTSRGVGKFYWSVSPS